MGISAIMMAIHSRFSTVWADREVGGLPHKEVSFANFSKDRPTRFMSMSGGTINNTELVAALVSTGRDIDGIRITQGQKIDGSLTMLILTKEGLYATHDNTEERR